jgi:hypothetical protein
MRFSLQNILGIVVTFSAPDVEPASPDKTRMAVASDRRLAWAIPMFNLLPGATDLEVRVGDFELVRSSRIGVPQSGENCQIHFVADFLQLLGWVFDEPDEAVDRERVDCGRPGVSQVQKKMGTTRLRLSTGRTEQSEPFSLSISSEY